VVSVVSRIYFKEIRRHTQMKLTPLERATQKVFKGHGKI
jgi:hypothetical protein